MILFEADRGKEVPALVGEEAEIVLFENPSTGFQWSIEKTEGIEVISSRYEQGSARIGSGGNRHWILRMKGSGRQKFQGRYRRSWEQVQGEEKTFDLVFLVKKKGR